MRLTNRNKPGVFGEVALWKAPELSTMTVVSTNQRALLDHLKTKRRSARNDPAGLFD